MIAPSAIPAMTDALVSAFTTAGATVYDGPGVTDDSPEQYVLVGVADPDDESLVVAGTSNQTWPWLGRVQRDEEGSIRCAIVSWSGDIDMKPVRDAAFTLFTDLMQALEADPGMGQGQPLWVSGIDNIVYRQLQSDKGPMGVIMFDVSFHARLSAS